MNQDEILRISLILFCILIVLLRTRKGYRKGLVGELSTMLSLVVAVVCLFLFMLLYTSFQVGTWGTTVTSIVMLIVFGVGYKIGKIMLAPLKGLKAVSFLNFIDKLLGAVLGFAEGILLVYVLQYVLMILEKPVLFPVPNFV